MDASIVQGPERKQRLIYQVLQGDHVALTSPAAAKFPSCMLPSSCSCVRNRQDLVDIHSWSSASVKANGQGNAGRYGRQFCELPATVKTSHAF